MNTCFPKPADRYLLAPQSVCARSNINAVISLVFLSVVLSACGGSGGGSGSGFGSGFGGGSDSGAIAQDVAIDQDAVERALLNDDQLCSAEIDIAEFFLTETDRQWSCEISSAVGTRFDDLYFDRSGSANFASSGVWYWNRNLPGNEINLASSTQPSLLMSDIGSFNTILVFRTINTSGFEETYDCVLVSRDVVSL